MPTPRRLSICAAAVIAAICCSGQPNSQPNPYQTIEGWFKLPAGRAWGSSSAIDIAPDGKTVWIAERCGANTCAGSTVDPVLHFDENGRLIKSFGSGMFIFPHGMFVDKQGNVWVTDGQGKNGIGHQVIKFSPDGKVLMRLGKAGVAGDGPDEFNMPSDVIVAPNNDIFVADGHGPKSNARIVKFDKNGKFIKTWGKQGTGPGEFDQPHGLAFDSKGRLFVADRSNNRIQIFDQNGEFLAEWKQFSRPSGLYIDKHDVLYVADSESKDAEGYGHNPGWQRGIRIGNIKDGKVEFFIPEPTHGTGPTSGAEGIAVDAAGHIYGAEVLSKSVVRYVKK
ncbi:MAG TPA: peptidyl-alpha-hydroxyglycine alpha-amidating lyase family protein [Bryobacteraceae bacterium]|jgi:sugar lactone lactonase YvrE